MNRPLPQPTRGNCDDLAVATIALSVWHDFRSAWGRLISFMVVFKLVELWLLAPAVALLLATILSQSGRVAVTNRDVLVFLWSPLGLMYAGIFGVVTIAMLLLEQAGIILLVGQKAKLSLPFPQLVLAGLPKILRIGQLGLTKMALLVATFVPFVVLLLLAYSALLSRHDIYFYWTNRPPIFWMAAILGLCIVLAAGLIGVWLYVRWSLALPIILFEQRFARDALKVSTQRLKGVGWRVAVLLFGWQLLCAVMGVAVAVFFRMAAATALRRSGADPLLTVSVLIVAQFGLLAVLSFVTLTGWALITRRIYLARSRLFGIEAHGEQSDQQLDCDSPRMSRRMAYAFGGVALVVPLVLWMEVPTFLAHPTVTKVTAHRGHARAAPENTASAIRKAIESGADYAEIDVQQTADGVIVLLHDRDLMRVAGDSRRLSALSYDEVRGLDVGRWFSAEFTGERIPTLREIIEIARGRIRLNIELKFFDSDHRLTSNVANTIRQQRFESDCLITSFHYSALKEINQTSPDLRTGLIVAHSLGDLSQLQIDALSVRADHLTDDLLRAARQRKLETHVWTVNDERQMTRLMVRGVDNLITSNPDLAIHVRTEVSGMTDAERLMLAAQVFLQIDQ